MAGNLRSAARNALRVAYVLGLPGVVTLVAGLFLRLGPVTGLGITCVAVALGRG